MQNPARPTYESEGFLAHTYLSGAADPLWEYQASKLTSALANEKAKEKAKEKVPEKVTEKPTWRMARTIPTVTIGRVPEQLKLDFGQRAQVATHKQPSALSLLERAANAKSEHAFVNALDGFSLKGCQPAEFIKLIKLSMKAGAYSAARHISEEAVTYYPDNVELQKYALVFSPPKVLSRDLPPNPAFKANREWLRENAKRYSGQWVAVRNGELVGVSDSFEHLLKHVGSNKEVLITRA